MDVPCWCRQSYRTTCYWYIELNPVRAVMVANPADCRWLSYRCNAEGNPSIIVTAHDLFLAISPNAGERRRRYRELFCAESNDDEIKEIRSATTFSMPLGSERFKSDVEAMLGRTIEQPHRGRPESGMRA